MLNNKEIFDAIKQDKDVLKSGDINLLGLILSILVYVFMYYAYFENIEKYIVGVQVFLWFLTIIGILINCIMFFFYIGASTFAEDRTEEELIIFITSCAKMFLMKKSYKFNLLSSLNVVLYLLFMAYYEMYYLFGIYFITCICFINIKTKYADAWSAMHDSIYNK